MNTNTYSADFIQILDDLLWLHARANSDDGPQEAAEAMIANYTDDPKHYSDGSSVGAEYIPDYAPNVICFKPMPPPHRRIVENRRKKIPSMTTAFDNYINVVDALTEFIIQHGAIKFGKLADYLETLDVNTTGDEALTGEHVNQPHVQACTTLLCPVSIDYVEIVEALFKTRPVMLEIGDPADFACHEEPWWVAWAGHAAALM